MDEYMKYEYERILDADLTAWNLYRPLREEGRCHDEALEWAMEYHLTMMGLNWKRPETYWACERSSRPADQRRMVLPAGWVW